LVSLKKYGGCKKKQWTTDTRKGVGKQKSKGQKKRDGKNQTPTRKSK